MAVLNPVCAAQGGQRLSGSSPGHRLQQRQQRRARNNSCCAAHSTTSEPNREAGAEREQRCEAAPLNLTPLQQAGRAAAGVAAAALLALGALPPPAEAVLANPRAAVARSADVALRRSIPAFNADVAAVQERLEAVAFKLRIPQVGWCGWAEHAAVHGQCMLLRMGGACC